MLQALCSQSVVDLHTSTMDTAVQLLLVFACIGCAFPFTLIDGQNYLIRYGYLAVDPPRNASQEFAELTVESPDVIDAIKQFQLTHNLTVDGTLNAETIAYMQKPRCGLPDSLIAYPKKWNTTRLTWYFYSAGPFENSVAKEAFDVWERQSVLRFTRRFSALDANILISYRNAPSHEFLGETKNCSFPFDDMVLAHAYFPLLNENKQEIHLNADLTSEFREVDASGQSKLFKILVHEIGHVLGVQHAAEEKSVMFSIFSDDTTFNSLSQHEIRSVERLYGHPATVASPPVPLPAKITTTTTTTKRPIVAVSPPPDLCQLDDISKFVIINGRMYILYKQYMWPVNMREKYYEAPILIRSWFKFLPADFQEITAVYQEPVGDIVALVQNQLYIIDSSTLLVKSGFPVPVGNLIPHSSKVNAIFNTYTGRTFAIYDNAHYTELTYCNAYYNIKKRERIEEAFPGIPPAVDWVFRYTNGLMYVFKNSTVYEYNEFSRTVVKASPFSLDLFQIECPGESLLVQLKGILFKLNNLLTSNAVNTHALY